MKPDDYIRGARHGREAHDLEIEAMCDPLLADALDGFDAVPGAPGEHSAALERLAEGIVRSASGGMAAARSRASRLRAKRIRGWSVAAVLLAAVAGGGTWLLLNGVHTDDFSTLASQTHSDEYRKEVVEKEILPPVTVIREEEAAPAAEPIPAPTDMPEMKLDHDELPVMAEEVVEEVVDVMAEAVIVSETVAEAVAVQSKATRAAGLSAPAQDLAQAEILSRDTTQTDAFRSHVADRNRVRGGVMCPVTISFEVDAEGRPRGIEIVDSPTPELGELARTLLDKGPDWPAEPSRKLITINL